MHLPNQVLCAGLRLLRAFGGRVLKRRRVGLYLVGKESAGPQIDSPGFPDSHQLRF